MSLLYCTTAYGRKTRSLNALLQLTVEPQNKITRVENHAQMYVQR
jgi:hypothetical protein